MFVESKLLTVTFVELILVDNSELVVIVLATKEFIVTFVEDNTGVMKSPDTMIDATSCGDCAAKSRPQGARSLLKTGQAQDCSTSVSGDVRKLRYAFAWHSKQQTGA